MGLIDFSYNRNQQLTIVEQAINYAVALTNNLIYITDLNSPYRILVEAQVYCYNQFLQRLQEVDRALTLTFLEIMGIVPRVASASRVYLKFSLLGYSANNIYFVKGFPVRASNGLIFVTESLISIPSGSMTGLVSAVCLTEGADGNVPPNTITQALQTISVPFTVTNEAAAIEGSSGESMLDAQMRLSALIRKSGLVTENDYRVFCRETIPKLVVSVTSPVPSQIAIYVCRYNGELLTTPELTSLRSNLVQNSFIGIDSLTVQNLEILDVFMEIVGSVRRMSNPESVALEIKNIIFSYLMPDNPRQIDENTAGIILINEVERQVNKSFVDFIQSVRIGLTESSAYGQNFVFNEKTQRVRIFQLKVTLIRDSNIESFNYFRT